MDRVHSPAALLRFIISSQSCRCFWSSARGFGGSHVGRVLLMTLSSMLGPTDFDGLWRAVGVGGSAIFAVVGVGSEDEEGRGRAEVEAATAWDDVRLSGEGGPLVRNSSCDATYCGCGIGSWSTEERVSPEERGSSSELEPT